MQIGIFIIAYNAEAHILETIKRIPPDIVDKVSVIYVIDDCSSDETVSTLLANKPVEKLVVMRNAVNQRYGGNQKFGYQYAIDQGLDLVVMLHADGQYAPEVLPDILAPILSGEAEVVIGSRMLRPGVALSGNMPLYKYLGNIFLTKIQNFITGMELSEFHSGYRAYRTSLLRSLPFWENTDEWHFDTQILLQAKKLGARIKEVPIPTYYGKEICNVNVLIYGINCLLSVLEYFLFEHGLLYSRKFDIENKGEKYSSKLDDLFSSHAKIKAKLLKYGLKGKKVLEYGVGDATLTRIIAREGATVDGVEIDPAAVEGARPFCRNIYHENLENINEIGLTGPYDIIVAADVLEHLKNPEEVLIRSKKHLKKSGLMVVCLPNVAHFYVRINLLLGRFPYHSRGILDKSHLRFYTYRSARQMLIKTGWKIKEEDTTSLPWGIVFPFLNHPFFAWFLRLNYGLTRAFKGLFAYQFIFYCENPNQSALL